MDSLWVRALDRARAEAVVLPLLAITRHVLDLGADEALETAGARRAGAGAQERRGRIGKALPVGAPPRVRQSHRRKSASTRTASR